MDYTHKFRNFWGSTKAIQRLSDTICLEHGLSIIEQPKQKGVHYGKWLGDQKPLSYREQLRIIIDAILERKPVSWEGFVQQLKNEGYKVKTGKQLSVRGASQKRFIRLDTLGDGYSQNELMAIVAGEKKHTPPKRSIPQKQTCEVDLLLDIQAKLQAGKGAGYERWAKKFNLKQMAQTLNYLTEHGLTDYRVLEEKASDASRRTDALLAKVKATESRIAEVSALRTHILNYLKTRDVYAEYRKSGYSAKFRAAHEPEILLHQAAKKAFDAQKLTKLPTVKSLNAEYAALLSQKKEGYAEYRKARAETRELLTAKANVDTLLGRENSRDKLTEKREKSRER